MRFLCLHGSGVNSQVFEAQTAALRYELGDNHTYEFVQGTTPTPMAPELKSLAAVDATYYAYYDPSSIPSYIRAVEQLDDYVSTEGPFDGVMAFSQGAGLAAMYLVHQSLQEPRQDSPFKVAIFISSIAAIYDPVTWFKDSQVRRLDPAVDGQPINIPTAHIWGTQDGLQSECRAVSELSDQASRAVFIHDGGHRVPGSSSPAAIAGAVQAIRRAVTTAMLGTEIGY